MAMLPSIALIMRAKNEMPYVEQALEQLARQSILNFDLFAVDSGSTDGTLQVLKKTDCHLQSILPEAYVPGKVMNEAIAQTEHDLIVLLNADAIPQSSDWLEQLILPLLENKADATFSKQIARPNAAFVVNYDYERAYSPKNMRPEFFSAVACAFKRELWTATPFRETGYAEDAAWAQGCVAQGGRFQWVENSVVEHSHNYSLKGLFQKRYRQALTFPEVPHLGKQIIQYLREIVRDLLHAGITFQLHTIPYNIAYRTTIHWALYRGRNDR